MQWWRVKNAITAEFLSQYNTIQRSKVSYFAKNKPDFRVWSEDRKNVLLPLGSEMFPTYFYYHSAMYKRWKRKKENKHQPLLHLQSTTVRTRWMMPYHHPHRPYKWHIPLYPLINSAWLNKNQISLLFIGKSCTYPKNQSCLPFQDSNSFPRSCKKFFHTT